MVLSTQLRSNDLVLEVRDLTVLSAGSAGRPLVDRVTLHLHAGEILGIVGESGSGKSTLALAMLGALRPGLSAGRGSVSVAGVNMFDAPQSQLSYLRRYNIAYVPQNAGLSLTPTMTIRGLIREVLQLRMEKDHRQLEATAATLLDGLDLNGTEIMARYPHQLSGGQQQRCALALALAAKPAILVLDEPTAGIDVAAQESIVEILVDRARTDKIATICITHDMRVAARLCTRIAVMYAGQIVEEAPCASLLNRPKHPYSRALIAAVPKGSKSLPAVIQGFAPSTRDVIEGCAFAPRCPTATSVCRKLEPARAISCEGSLMCHHAHDWALLDDEEPRPSPSLACAAAHGHPLLQVKDVAVEIRVPAQSREKAIDRRRRILDSINLSVSRGRTLGIVGASGSGKSTLLKIMAGVLLPSSGEIIIDGTLEPTRSLETRRRIQLVWQNAAAALNPRQTVHQAIHAPLSLYHGLGHNQSRRRASDLLELVRLGPDYLDRLPSQLSGGEAQRVALARACAAKPDLLLCDEITSALDVSVQATVLALLEDIRRKTGCAIVFVSHDMSVVGSIADDIVILEQGRICASLDVEQFAERFLPNDYGRAVAFAEFASASGSGLRSHPAQEQMIAS